MMIKVVVVVVDLIGSKLASNKTGDNYRSTTSLVLLIYIFDFFN